MSTGQAGQMLKALTIQKNLEKYRPKVFASRTILVLWANQRLREQSSLFLWGASLTSTPYIASTYTKGTAQRALFCQGHCCFLLFPLQVVFQRISSNQIQNLSSKSFFAEDVVKAEVSPDEDPLRLPSLSLTQTTHRLATEHLQVNHHDHADVGDDDYIDGDGDCAKNIGIRIGDICEKDCECVWSWRW